jgi:hypothetical protein
MKYLIKLQVSQWERPSDGGGEKLVDNPTLTLEVNAEDAANAIHKLQRTLQGALLNYSTSIFYVHDR